MGRHDGLVKDGRPVCIKGDALTGLMLNKL